MSKKPIEQMSEEEKDAELSQIRERKENGIAYHKFRNARHTYLFGEMQRVIKENDLNEQITPFEKTKEDYL